MYEVKPIAAKSSGSIKAEKNREREKEKETTELAEKKAHHAKQEALTKEIIESSNDIAKKIDSSSQGLTESLTGLSNQIDKIKLEIPKQDNTDIVSAINGFSEITSNLLSNLSESVANIKLETQEIDLNQHTEVLTQTIDQNIASLEGVIGELVKSVKAIKFETEQPPLEWIFEVERNDDGYIEQIHAVVPTYELDS